MSSEHDEKFSGVAIIGSLLRKLVDLHVSPDARESALQVASRLLESSLTTSPSMQTAEALTKSMLFRFVREGKNEEASRLGHITTGLKFERAIRPENIWPILYILNDLRGTGDTSPIRTTRRKPKRAQTGLAKESMNTALSANIVSKDDTSTTKVGDFRNDLSTTTNRVRVNPFKSAPNLNIEPPKAYPSNSINVKYPESANLPVVQSANILGFSVEREPILAKPITSARATQRPKEFIPLQNRTLEEQIGQDLLLIVQGENGSILSFQEDKDEAVSILLPSGTELCLPVRDITLCVAEIGFLFRKIRNRVEEKGESQKGLVVQNMCQAIVCEMDTYYRSLVTLRGSNDTNSGESKEGGEITLRRIFVWAEREKPRLRWLARLCQETRSLSGGQIIAHLRNRRGSYVAPEIRDMMSRILASSAAPINQMLVRWLSEGVLHDPDEEFFIMEDPKIALTMKPAPHATARLMEEGGISHGLAGGPNEASAASDRIWWGLFRLRKHKLPGGVDTALAKKSLMTGKSIAFLRRCCEDGEWVDRIHAPIVGSMTPPKSKLFEADSRIDEDIVREVIEKSRNSASKRLKQLFFEKFDLSFHFGAIKRYLLLSQGDFTQALMDGLAPILDGTGDILRSNLTGFVDSALQASSSFNESTDQEILERLDVQLVSIGNKAQVGWDVFSLTYRVEDAPLNTIFSVKVMEAYLLIFRFLWQLKRLDHLMVRGYMDLRYLDERRRRRLLSSREDVDSASGINAILRRLHFLRMKMTHLVQNMQHYCTVEVLQGSWSILEQELGNAEDLDGMIYAHSKYLTVIKDRTLLSDRSKYVAIELQRVLQVVLVFDNLQNNVRRYVNDRYDKKTENVDDDSNHALRLNELTNQVGKVEDAFFLCFTRFLTVLRTHSKVVDTCVFLVSRLDYNEYYSRQSAAVMEDSAKEEESLETEKVGTATIH